MNAENLSRALAAAYAAGIEAAAVHLETRAGQRYTARALRLHLLGARCTVCEREANHSGEHRRGPSWSGFAPGLERPQKQTDAGSTT